MLNKNKKETVRCDLCDSNNSKFLLRSRDFRFGHREWFDFSECKNCGLIYLNPRPTKESLLSHYDENYTPDDTNYIRYLSKRKCFWKEKLRPLWYRFIGFYSVLDLEGKGKFLDIGCSTGDTLEFAKNKGFDVYGVELNPKMVQICKEKGFNVYCSSIEDAKFPSNMFDVIWMSQVFEHLPSPKSTIKEMKRILKPGGRLYIYCPNAGSYLRRIFGIYWGGWYVPFHLYVFTEKTIKSLANNTGFILEELITSTPDSHFIVSLKSSLWGRAKNGKRPIDRGRILDTILFRVIISIFLRVLDLLSPGQGDCIKAVFKKSL